MDTEAAPSNLQDEMLRDLYQQRRELNRMKRQLEKKGFDDFIRKGDKTKLHQSRQITKQIGAINTQIEFIKQSGSLVTTYKLESNWIKRDYVAEVNSFGKEK